ncbi:MAG: YdcF family protein, partial [Lachnospiraceae bacterium]|nr:YdcF family protein [Lachnospiraceae bacterium]
RFSRELMNKQKPKIIVVTTAYHVFRALILAKRQGIKCVGFGAKTKWYFTLNAFIREFVGYLRLTWKKHALVVGIVVVIIINCNLGG